jgi:hypothetical protein
VSYSKLATFERPRWDPRGATSVAGPKQEQASLFWGDNAGSVVIDQACITEVD